MAKKWAPYKYEACVCVCVCVREREGRVGVHKGDIINMQCTYGQEAGSRLHIQPIQQSDNHPE